MSKRRSGTDSWISGSGYISSNASNSSLLHGNVPNTIDSPMNEMVTSLEEISIICKNVDACKIRELEERQLKEKEKKRKRYYNLNNSNTSLNSKVSSKYSDSNSSACNICIDKVKSISDTLTTETKCVDKLRQTNLATTLKKFYKAESISEISTSDVSDNNNNFITKCFPLNDENNNTCTTMNSSLVSGYIPSSGSDKSCNESDMKGKVVTMKSAHTVGQMYDLGMNSIPSNAIKSISINSSNRCVSPLIDNKVKIYRKTRPKSSTKKAMGDEYSEVKGSSIDYTTQTIQGSRTNLID
jgi:sporulation protein YlmC with PRC-barrel domain